MKCIVKEVFYTVEKDAFSKRMVCLNEEVYWKVFNSIIVKIETVNFLKGAVHNLKGVDVNKS